MSDRTDFRPPPVHAVLGSPELAPSLSTRGREATLHAIRSAIAEVRSAIREGTLADLDPPSIARRAAAMLDADRPILRPVINASGVLLHTGLGRAPLASEAAEAVDRVVSG